MLDETESVIETLTPIHALGTITYDRDAGTYNYSLGYYGTTGSSIRLGNLSGQSRITPCSFPNLLFQA